MVDVCQDTDIPDDKVGFVVGHHLTDELYGWHHTGSRSSASTVLQSAQ